MIVAMSTGGRLRQRGRRRPGGSRATAASRRTSCPTRTPSTASACTRSPSTRATRTGCTRRTTTASTAATTRGGQWTSIADGLPADFGFPILASPRDPGTAWVVPLVADGERVPPDGRLRVHRTRDAGATWHELGDGLPDDSWTVVLRDAACVDAADPTGVYVGTRDGCVYASADDGDTFTVVADHLPDVLVVRAVELGVSRPRWSCCSRAASPTSPAAARSLTVEAPGGTLADLLDALADEHPPLERRIRDETGAVRRHVNVYVDGDDVRAGEGLATAVGAGRDRPGAAVDRRRQRDRAPARRRPPRTPRSSPASSASRCPGRATSARCSPPCSTGTGRRWPPSARGSPPSSCASARSRRRP